MSQAANELNDEWLKRIKEQTEGLLYGTVLITIHNGRIVQIDRTERSRFDTVKADPAARTAKYRS